MSPTPDEPAETSIRHLWGTTGMAVALLLTGCSRFFNLAEPPPDRGIVYDHWIEDIDGLDYALIDIDGRPLVREKPPFGVDMNPGAVVVAGEHTFKVGEIPHLRLPASKTHQVLFTAEVEGGKRYFISTRHDLPVLIEWRKANQPPVPKDGAVH